MVDVMTVGTTFRIAEVARRTGFTNATLRYYESIGLMPPAERTSAGYRSYDERALRRLGFIARAKQLGCTLEEITALAQAWDGDECAPVQHRLKALVEEKLELTRAQIGEMLALADDLEATSHALSVRPLDGPCDDSCGCMTVGELASSTTQPVGVALGAKPDKQAEPAIVCSLDAAAMPDRLRDWQALLGKATARRNITGGIRVEFDATASVDEIGRLAAAEQDCCRFFSFAITIDDRGSGLEVTAPPDAAGIIDDFFGGTA